MQTVSYLKQMSYEKMALFFQNDFRIPNAQRRTTHAQPNNPHSPIGRRPRHEGLVQWN